MPYYPRWVRWLSVFYALSFILGPLGFFILMGVAFGFAIMRKELDSTVISLGVAGLACPFVMASFRAWFEAWGRRHYGGPANTSPSEIEP
jgi:hypothetical protein